MGSKKPAVPRTATRTATLKALVDAAEKKKGPTFDVPFKTKRIPLNKIRVEADLPLFRIQSGRTHRAQCRYLEEHNVSKDFFSDPDDPKVQKAQYEILLTMIGEKELDVDLNTREQLNPIVLTSDGTVVDGNRRLAALRQMKESYVEAVVLPEGATSNEIYETELEFQMQKDTKAEYDWINEALHLEYGISELKETDEKIAKKMRLGVAEVRKQLEKLSLVKQYLAWANVPAQYHKVPSGSTGSMEQAFDDMVTRFAANAFKRKTEKQKRIIREACFAAIKQERGYKEIRELIKQMSGNLNRVAQKVRERVPKKPAKQKAKAVPKGKKPKARDDDDPLADLADAAEPDDDQDLEDISEALESTEGAGAVFDAVEEAEMEEREAKRLQLPLQRVNRAIKELEAIELTKDSEDLKNVAKALGTLGKLVDKLGASIEKLVEK
ncbi:MAG TPA: hypothetical protein VNO30_18290 [Kofleriaceae bacterium]|nr:hypothetical protein [Kofleriaceae bacterium]